MYQVRTIERNVLVSSFKTVEEAEYFCDKRGWKSESGKTLFVTYKEVN